MKDHIEYKKSVTAYLTSGSVFSSNIISDSLEEIDILVNEYIEKHKDSSEAITIGNLVVTTINYSDNNDICYLLKNEEEIKNPYFYMKYYKDNNKIKKYNETR